MKPTITDTNTSNSVDVVIDTTRQLPALMCPPLLLVDPQLDVDAHRCHEGPLHAAPPFTGAGFVHVLYASICM